VGRPGNVPGRVGAKAQSAHGRSASGSPVSKRFATRIKNPGYLCSEPKPGGRWRACCFLETKSSAIACGCNIGLKREPDVASIMIEAFLTIVWTGSLMVKMVRGGRTWGVLKESGIG